MEITRESVNSTRRTLTDDPQYFGGYLNMARHNVFCISNHISKYFGQPILTEEGVIKNSFLCKKEIKKLNWNHVFKRTLRFLPIIKVFDVEKLPKEEQLRITQQGKDFAAMSDILKVMFGELQEFRNDYSHYYSTEKADSRKTEVSDIFADFLKLNFNRAIAYTKLRKKDVLTDDNYKLIEKIPLINSDGKTITTEGLVFFTCMFLEREHAFRFIGKITGLKGTQHKEFIATREVLMAFCIQLPHEKFVSEDFSQALILDISNELNRCPKTLYNVITEKAKQQFRPELDSEKTSNVIENSIREDDAEIDYDQYIEMLTKRVRHKNRFSYFSLRYIDETDMLGEYRFQIDLGKFVLANYEKQLQGEGVPRLVVENAKGFGKLSSLMDEDTVRAKIDNQNRTDGFEQFAPHYNDDNNKIGLSTEGKNAILRPKSDENKRVAYNLSQPQPQAFISVHELPKVILLDYLEKGKAEELIKNFIRFSDEKLLTMNFIGSVKNLLPEWKTLEKMADPVKKPQPKKDPESQNKAQELRQKKSDYLLSVEERKQELNTILAKYNLNYKQIPTRILDYWLNITDVSNRR